MTASCFDTHCHLPLVAPPAEEVVDRARACGVAAMVTVGIDLASSAECTRIATALDGVWAAVGIHPNNAIEATDGVLDRIRDLADHPAVVGIGETGLDWFREGAPRVRQEESFREHIRLAKERDKALIIHDRDAHHDVVRVLLDEGAPPRTVFHCFSGGPDLVETCAAHGWFASYAGNVTFRNAPLLQEAARRTPLDLLVAETDSPFLSPHPHRGSPNEPCRVPLTVAFLASLHDATPDDMAAATSSNAARLFALPHD